MYRLKSGKHRYQDGRVIKAGDPVEEPIPKSLIGNVEEVIEVENSNEDENKTQEVPNPVGAENLTNNTTTTPNTTTATSVPDEFSSAVLDESGETIGIWLETVSDLNMIKKLREVEIANKNRSTVVTKFDRRIAALS